MKCEWGMDIKPCEKNARYMNQNGVCLCLTHKRLLDAFTWEGRNKRHWDKITRSYTKGG